MIEVNRMFSDLLNQAPPLRLNQQEVRQLLSRDEYDEQMTSIDLQKEFSRTKKEGTGGHTGSARLSPRNKSNYDGG